MTTTTTYVLTLEIRCIRKSDRYDPSERITHVGGLQNGRRWLKTQADAIAEIERGLTRFFTEVNGKRVRVVVAVSRFGNKYLRTEADRAEENNLLSLPECP